jgi:hypothetical protein
LEQGDSATAKERPLRYRRADPVDLAGRRRCRDSSRDCIAKGLHDPRRSLLRSSVITEAGTNARNVVGLVYVSAFAPDEGESLGDLYARAAAPGVAHVRPDDEGFLWIDPEAFGEAFAQDVDPVQARILAVVQKPIAARIFGDKITRPAWELKPSWVSRLRDRSMDDPCGDAALYVEAYGRKSPLGAGESLFHDFTS